MENSEKFGKFYVENYFARKILENLEKWKICALFCVENLENSMCGKFGKWKNLENFYVENYFVWKILVAYCWLSSIYPKCS